MILLLALDTTPRPEEMRLPHFDSMQKPPDYVESVRGFLRSGSSHLLA